MRLRYKLTRLDLFIVSFQVLLFQPVFLIVVISILAFAWWNTFASAEITGYSLQVRIIAAMLSVAQVTGACLLVGTLMIATKTFLCKDKGVIGEHTLEITDEGLVESTEVNRSLSNWSAPFRIREMRRYVYIYISSGSAHVVPKTKPPLEGSVAEFIAELRSRIGK